MKKVSTVAASKSRNFSEQKLTTGFDLGDQSSWYCVLDEAGRVLLEQKVSTTPKPMQEVFGGMPRCRIALEPTNASLLHLNPSGRLARNNDASVKLS
jgi:transposase